jgi:IS5 family transposase
VDGYALVEKMSWNNYNEALTLQEAVERYRERYGHYPEAVLADQIYRNRENRKYCKEKGIRLSGLPMGQPAKKAQSEQKHIAHKDSADVTPLKRTLVKASAIMGWALFKHAFKKQVKWSLRYNSWS